MPFIDSKLTMKISDRQKEEIKSELGKPFTVRYAGKTRDFTLAAGKSVRLGPEL